VVLYGLRVKPPAEDLSRPQAKLNAAKLLRAGREGEDLAWAIVNYGRWCDTRGKEAGYRKNVGNFFGRQAVFETYMPGVYVAQAPPSAARPPATLADRNRASLEAMRRQAERKGSRERGNDEARAG
jgi:hypothetical protein